MIQAGARSRVLREKHCESLRDAPPAAAHLRMRPHECVKVLVRTESSGSSASSPAENPAAGCCFGYPDTQRRSQGRPQPSRSDASAFVDAEVWGSLDDTPGVAQQDEYAAPSGLRFEDEAAVTNERGLSSRALASAARIGPTKASPLLAERTSGFWARVRVRMLHRALGGGGLENAGPTGRPDGTRPETSSPTVTRTTGPGPPRPRRPPAPDAADHRDL